MRRAVGLLAAITVLFVALAAYGYGYFQATVWMYPLSAAALLEKIRAEGADFRRLDLVVEYPFGAAGGPYVTLAGCADSQDVARRARRFLYAEGAQVVFDSTSRTPTGNLATPEYVESVCSRTDWMRDGRSVFKHMALPMAPANDLAHIPAADRERVRVSLDAGEDLQALGVSKLAWALQEIHRDLTLWKRGVYDPETLIRHIQMKLEILARMPPQDVQGESLSPAEWKKRQREASERFMKMMKEQRR